MRSAALAAQRPRDGKVKMPCDFSRLIIIANNQQRTMKGSEALYFKPSSFPATQVAPGNALLGCCLLWLDQSVEVVSSSEL